MAVRLKRLGEQVMVVTGASSGIGLVTARLAAARGARVVMVARGGATLEQAAAEIREGGGAVMPVVADVGEPGALDRVAERVTAEFGRLDTWVNNAGVGLYGRLEEVPLEDQRRLFETNFWGVVYGCRAALPLLRRQGGALINIGSVEGDLSMPLSGVYAASKHAVKAYTDALRMELLDERAPVAVTLVRPTAIGTPFFEHARSYLGVEPAPPPPVYAPETVARAILHCAQHPRRSVRVGAPAKVFPTVGALAPGLTERVMARTMIEAQRGDRPSRGSGALHHPPRDVARERGWYDGRIRERSAYTAAVLRPGRTALAAVGVGLALAWGARAMGEE